MEIPKELQSEIWEFCKVNNITNVDAFTLKMLKQGFTADKFGSSPIGGEPKTVEVEKIIEKIVEKEVIKEVEVEKIVYQDKEVFVTDDEAVNALTERLDGLESENNDLYVDLNTRKNEVGRLNDTIKRLEGAVEKLTKELEEEKGKLKQENKKDIYSEKKGTFGSNISDIWNRKKPQ